MNDPKKNSATSEKSCDRETQVYSRVVGYIRPIDHWNEAKKEEFEERTEYRVEEE